MNLGAYTHTAVPTVSLATLIATLFTLLHRSTPKVVRKALVQHRKHTNLGLIAFIGWSMIHEGAGVADLGFLVLALLTELEPGLEG